MTAIVFPHVCCNGGIITDLSGYGCILGNLGLGEAAILPAANGSLSGNGWCKFPLTQGKTLIIQWGEVNVSKQDQVAQLPIAFPATILQAVSSDSGGSAFSVGISGRGNTGLIFRVDNSRFLNGQNVVCRYIAIGF